MSYGAYITNKCHFWKLPFRILSALKTGNIFRLPYSEDLLSNVIVIVTIIIMIIILANTNNIFRLLYSEDLLGRDDGEEEVEVGCPFSFHQDHHH